MDNLSPALSWFWAIVWTVSVCLYVALVLSFPHFGSDWIPVLVHTGLLVLTGLELALELRICFRLTVPKTAACKLILFFQDIIIGYNVAVICSKYSNGSVVWLWLNFISSVIRFILFLAIYSVAWTEENQQPTPQLSQPRPNLLANEPPTTAMTNFEDVEQPPPSYEEYLAQINDLPPKYEDLESPPPAYQETMV